MADYDVAVVGGGPAGSTLAYRLASAGIKTLLLEQATYPRKKPCGGGLDGIFFQHLPPGMSVASVVEDWTTQFIIASPKERKTYDLPAPMALTRRERLDEHLARQAAAAGADLHEGEKLTDYSGFEAPIIIRTTQGIYTANVLVGADGAYSAVARIGSFTSARDVFVASEWDVKDRNLAHRYENAAVFDFSAKPLGYYWIFPKGGELNLGFGTSKAFAKGLNKQVAAYNQKWMVRGEAVKAAHWIPFARRGFQAVKGNVLLVGDAAGVADPATGGGIGWAVRSGGGAGRCIQTYLDHGSAFALTAYQSYHAALLAELAAGVALRNCLLLSLLVRGKAWDSGVRAVLDCLSGKASYLQWKQAHPAAYLLGLAIQKLVVPRVT